MKRDIFCDLLEWVDRTGRKPLILRGARQVGKSYLVNQLGKRFDNFVKVNFEETPSIGTIFEGDLNINNLLTKLQIATNSKIEQGKTLLFFDEIQNAPKALVALRYFYENLPGLHIIAAGSLIEFVIEKAGIPVGRVRSLYVYPMSFAEYLSATGNELLRDLLASNSSDVPVDDIFHKKLLELVKEYIIIGGMPEAVKSWIEKREIREVKRIHNDLVDTYKQDFGKYAKASQVKYVDKIFDAIPAQLGRKFVFSRVDSSLKTRELRPALELLEKAQVATIVYHSSANGVPLGAEVNHSLFKVIFVDIALTQTILGISPEDIFLRFNDFVNQGELIEAFVGQELLAYSYRYSRASLYYWNREKTSSNAEVDYVIAKNRTVYPVEVKSGASMRLKSLIQFLKEKEKSHVGIHFSTKNFGRKSNVRRFPIYGVFAFMANPSEC